MTLEEKFREMNCHEIDQLCHRGRLSVGRARKFFAGRGIGTLLFPARLPIAQAVAAVRDTQRFLKKHTRLGIPAIIFHETLHGLYARDSTVFPQIIGMASTWNPALVETMAATAAREARAAGLHQGLAPDLDLARDPRWGRVEESYGEDPYLVSRMGVAYVRGLQGRGPGVDREHIVATLKHFVAYGSPESGINLSPVAVGPRELRDTYLVPFKAGVVEAGVLSVMPAYHEIDGIPCHANAELLTRILRQEWGFAGYTFADFGGPWMLHRFHRTASSFAQAGRQALEAGLDLEANLIDCYNDELREQVRRGEVDPHLVDQAAGRVLRVKFLAGLFEETLPQPAQAARVIGNARHRALTLEAAREAIVLLKNERNLLPLGPKVKTIAVIGPNAAEAQLGGYVINKEGKISPLAGIRALAGKGRRILHASGCPIYTPDRSGFDAALRAARAADVVIAAVGEVSSTTVAAAGAGGASGAVVGEGFDRSKLGLPGVQEELVAALLATGKPVVVLLINGRPLAIEDIVQKAPAILEAWFPGEQGGRAIAEILFGQVNPSGKLPISFPRSVGQVPVFYNHKKSARGYYHKPGNAQTPGRDYVDGPTTPLFEFGFGLSYTKFRYSRLRLAPGRIGTGGRVQIAVDVANVGKREGKEVVQLFLTDDYSSVSTPVRALKRFTKVTLRPGQKRTVEFVLGPEDLSLIDVNLNRVVEPGSFTVSIAGLKKQFEVVAQVS
jgi:beta-glucosidase